MSLTTKLKTLLFTCFLFVVFITFAQNSSFKSFKKLSVPEKWWVIWHPFVAKKAYQVSIKTRSITLQIKKDSILIGNGSGQQIDAFRHTYWMAILTQEIGRRKAKKLGKAHEKGNYRTYKKGENEDGILPDQISSEMDLYNNNVGIAIGENAIINNYKIAVIKAIKKGECKIIKTDKNGNYLDFEGNIILKEKLKGKWKNDKCLIDSNLL